jgi:uncharacterized membrane protein (TIGR02234 family)
MTGGRAFATTIGCWVLGAAVALVAAGRVWGEQTARSATGARVHAQVTGHDVASALAPCAAALLALALFVFAARGWLRRLTGVTAALLGVAVVAAALAGRQDVGPALAAKSFAVQSTTAQLPANGWAWAAVVAGLLVAACGLVTAVFGPRWSGLGRRYDAPGVEPLASDDDTSRWAALDRGEDPTA